MTSPSLRFVLLVAGFAALGVGCSAEAVGDGSGAATYMAEECTLVGFGTLPAGDEFGGDATGIPDGAASGVWEHFTPYRPGESDCDDDVDEDMDEDVDEDMDEDIDEDSDEDIDEDSDEDIDEDSDEDIDEDHHGHGHGHARRRGRGHDHHRGRGRGHDRHGCGCDDDPDPVRDHFVGDVETLACFINGSNVAAATGSGKWNGDSGYTFELGVVDSGASDEYTFIVYDSMGDVVYDVNGFPDSGVLEVVEH